MGRERRGKKCKRKRTKKNTEQKWTGGDSEAKTSKCGLFLSGVQACEVCAGGGHKRWFLEFLFWPRTEQWISQPAIQSAARPCSPSCSTYCSLGFPAATWRPLGACATSHMQAWARTHTDHSAMKIFGGGWLSLGSFYMTIYHHFMCLILTTVFISQFPQNVSVSKNIVTTFEPAANYSVSLESPSMMMHNPS